jgi:hypothetical protein
MNPFDVDVDAIHRGADELERAKEGVRETFESFQAALEGYADAFGGDEIGMLLSVAHQACVGAAAECFNTNIEELAGYVDTLHDMADDYQSADDEIASTFSKMLGSFGA